jgi:adenosylcobinamide-GDP ribazoletransferase
MINTLLAACIFFTRLPFGQIREVPSPAFRHIITCWPLTGWLTGGLTAGVLWLCAQAFPLSVAILLALCARVCLTGALHEDGWADFLDGFGGGGTREQTLAIMKDSSVGSYGIIGLIFYFLLLWSVLATFPLPAACVLVMSADAWSKSIAAQLPNVLPYARKETESKSGTLYERMSWRGTLFSILCGLLPPAVFLPARLWAAVLFPPLVFLFMYRTMKKHLQGYTGDCCGAVFVACELSFYLAAALAGRIF